MRLAVLVTSSPLSCVTHRLIIFHEQIKEMSSVNSEPKVKIGGTPIMYPNLESILKVFEQPDNSKVNGVSQLLNQFQIAKSQQEAVSVEAETKHPFIVLEGLDGSGKTSVGKRFAKKINAVNWKTPPESISHIRYLFDDHPTLRTAYYSLGNYIAAYEVQTQLGKSPVLMDRYWHSTAAYTIAQFVQQHPNDYPLPPEGDVIYKWPEDLFKPDIVIFLNVSEEVRKQRQSRRVVVTDQENLLNNDLHFRQNVIQAYRNMYEPGVKFINGGLGFRLVMEQIQTAINPLLKT